MRIYNPSKNTLRENYIKILGIKDEDITLKASNSNRVYGRIATTYFEDNGLTAEDVANTDSPKVSAPNKCDCNAPEITYGEKTIGACRTLSVIDLIKYLNSVARREPLCSKDYMSYLSLPNFGILTDPYGEEIVLRPGCKKCSTGGILVFEYSAVIIETQSDGSVKEHILQSAVQGRKPMSREEALQTMQTTYNGIANSLNAMVDSFYAGLGRDNSSDWHNCGSGYCYSSIFACPIQALIDAGTFILPDCSASTLCGSSCYITDVDNKVVRYRGGTLIDMFWTSS